MKKYLAIIICVAFCFSLALSATAITPNRFSLIIDNNYATPPEISDTWYADAYKFCIDELFFAEATTYINDGSYKTYITNYDFIGDRLINRSDIAVVLDRYMWVGSSYFEYYYKDDTVSDKYVDVADGQYYTGSINWLTVNDITNGVGGKYFAPHRTVTREEFATMMYRFTTSQLWMFVDTSERAPLDTFEDASSVSAWAEDAMSWAVAVGLISGKPGNLLAPQDNITKHELATIIYRFNNNVRAHEGIVGWGEPD